MRETLAICGGRIIGEWGIEERDIIVAGGLIQEPNSPDVTITRTLDANGQLIFPGLIDCHVHFREPGAGGAEDMESGASAARSGGVTTVCDMPNTNPPTCTRQALEDKRLRARRIRGVDIRFFFGITKREHLKELASLSREDIVGVKLYLDHSTGNQRIDSAILEEAFALCAQLRLPVFCHCEDAEMNLHAEDACTRKDCTAHSLRRPPASEAKAIEDAILLAEKTGAHLHIAHLSTREGVDLVRGAKSDNISVTCEVAPHHLFLTMEDYAHLGTLGKMNPPLRTADHAIALWLGLLDHSIDCIATDHAPHTLAAKQSDDPLAAPSGVPGVETMFPLLLSCALHGGPTDQSGAIRGFPDHRPPLTFSDIRRACFDMPNSIFHLGKHGLTPGKPADIVLVNPGKSHVIHGSQMHSRCAWTPYENWKVSGLIETLETPE